MSIAGGQLRHQRRNGARSSRGQKIIQPGHPGAVFLQKKLTTFFLFLVVALKTQTVNVAGDLRQSLLGSLQRSHSWI